MNLLLFLLICWGMTQIITTGKIFEPIRNYLNLEVLRCSMCMGMWVGIIIFLGFWFCGIQLFPNIYIGSFFFGCISSAVSFFLMSVVKEDGIHINIH